MDFADIRVGSHVRMGGVDWDAVYEEAGRFLLLAHDVLQGETGIRRIRFHNRIGDATWEGCSLRDWLNGEFLEAFTPEERTHICTSRVVNYDSSRYGTPGGADTLDRVFCLSVETVRSLLSEEQMKASHCWYLRSPGFQASYAANVRENGGVFEFGRHVFLEFYGIRPAMWVSAQPCVEDASAMPFVSLFGFDGMSVPARMRLAMAYLASYPADGAADARGQHVLDFARQNMDVFADAAFVQANAEEIVLGAVRAGLVDAGNVDDFLDRARVIENWSLVADLLEHRAYGVSFGDGLSEDELLELEVFGGLD